MDFLRFSSFCLALTHLQMDFNQKRIAQSEIKMFWCFRDRFRHALMTWGDKFSAKEVDDAFDAMEIDDKGRIDTAALINLLTGSQDDEEGGEAA